MVGSPYWMPPEMIFHLPQTVKADVWSLACTLLQMLEPATFDLGSAIEVSSLPDVLQYID